MTLKGNSDDMLSVLYSFLSGVCCCGLFVCLFFKKAPFAFWELSQMHPGSVAEPQVKVGGQAFLDTWLFPHVLSHKELKSLGKEETKQVCKCLEFAS